MTRAYVAFAFLCVVFGTTFGAIEIGIADGWPPLLAAGARFALAGLVVLGLAMARGDLRAFRRADVAQIVAIGLTVTTGTFGALYSAERVLPSGLAALLSATSPLFAVALAVLRAGPTRRSRRPGRTFRRSSRSPSVRSSSTNRSARARGSAARSSWRRRSHSTSACASAPSASSRANRSGYRAPAARVAR